MSDNKLIKAIKDKGKNLESEMSFFDHLETLRWHLIRSALAVVVFMGIAFWNFKFLFNAVIMGPRHLDFWTYRMMCNIGTWLNHPGWCIDKIGGNIINTEMAGQFLLQLNSSMLIGIVAAFPYILYELWRFIRPALHENEQKAARGFVFYATMLFVVGILFGYYLIAPEGIIFLTNYSVSDTINNQFTISSYLSIIATITLLTGIVFELPMVIYILASLGILTGTFMRKTRRYAIIIIMIVGAIISPSPDLLSTTIATIPLLLLYEVGIVVASVIEKRKLKEHDDLMAS
jgi:sec-independent protein translocase protein TatC